MMKQMMHSWRQPHDPADADETRRRSRESTLDTVGWALFFIWVGASWLAGLQFGYMLLGIGIVTLALQGARYLLHVGVEAFWVLVGCGFFVAGYWELWDVGIPLAPIVLIVAGISLLASKFRNRQGKK